MKLEIEYIQCFNDGDYENPGILHRSAKLHRNHRRRNPDVGGCGGQDERQRDVDAGVGTPDREPRCGRNKDHRRNPPSFLLFPVLKMSIGVPIRGTIRGGIFLNYDKSRLIFLNKWREIWQKSY